MIEYPPHLHVTLSKMSVDQQRLFEARYARRQRSMGAMVALAILFPIHFFFLDKVTVGILYWVLGILTLGIVWIPWWIVNLCLVAGWVREHNSSIANEIALEIANTNTRYDRY